MPDSKITALASIGTGTDPVNDALVIVDVSDVSPGGMSATGTTKKVTLNNLLACSPTATLASATISGDLTVRTTGLVVNTTGVGVNITPSVRLHASDSDNPANGTLRLGSAGIYGQIKNSASSTGKLEFTSVGTGASGGYNFSIEGQNAHRIEASGVFNWFDGAGGTRMTLNATGLGVGAVPSIAKLELQSVTDTLSLINSTNTVQGNRAALFMAARNANGNVGNVSIEALSVNNQQNDLVFRTGSTTMNGFGTERMRIDTFGNVGIGVAPSAWATYKAVSVGGIGASVFGLGTSQAGIAQGAFFNNGAGSGWAYSATSQVPTYYLQINGENIWNIASSGTAGAQITAWTPAMKLDASGNLILLSSNTPATLTTNGQLTVNATSNTNLRFSYRGSDGVTRTANITLA